MKKLISLTLSAALCLGLFAGCGKQNAPAATETTAPAYASSLEVLEKVWATFPEEDRFPAAGGDGQAHRRCRHSDPHDEHQHLLLRRHGAEERR